jgi:uncharacterized membrane protein (UPF0182 family)
MLPAAMGDVFDDFLDELKRRQATGGRSGRLRRVGPDDPGPGGPNDGGDGDGGGSGRSGPRRPSGGRRPGIRGYALIWIVGVVLLAFFIFGRGLLDLWTDVLWYRSVGYEQVLWTRLGAQAGLFALGGLVALVVLLGNLWLAGRLAVPPADGSRGMVRGWIDRMNRAATDRPGAASWRGGFGGQYAQPTVDFEFPDGVRIGRYVLTGFAVLVILGAAAAFSGAWETILLWQNRVPFSPTGAAVTDPIFHRDISFFLFELPFLRLAQSFLVGLLVATLLLVVARYFLSAVAAGLDLTPRVRLHVGVLAALVLLAIAWGYTLDKLELVYSSRGVGTGVSYTDANAQFFAFDALTVLAGVAAVVVVAGVFTRRLLPMAAAIGVWFAASIVLGGLYPAAIQQLVVQPNAYAQEKPYIANNIAMTRLAFGFAHADASPAWDDAHSYQGTAPLTQAAITSDKATFDNARLWDYRPLGNTLDQLQTIRPYYDFFDVDTDRYQIGGVERQVMLSARELNLAGNANATGFVNQNVIFTHGIGVAMVPVNEVASEGQPELFIGNLPPVSTAGAPDVKEPRIYFGERPSNYIVVGAKQAEFDYPPGQQIPGGTDTGGVETRWSGTTGIPLDSITRLLFAIRFGDLDLLISDQVTPQSQLLFHRTISDRVPRIAPFLRFDKDPYVVINGSGRLVYMWDAYTTSDLFPHSTEFAPADLPPNSNLGDEPFNYIRNSVKITVDAYDGKMTFYVADPADPLIRAWQRVFPGVFRPLSDMPADLAAHIRVPEEGFDVQTRVYGRYHVTDPLTFFQSNDLWTVPTPAAQGEQETLPSEAYYVIMRMPGEANAEFLLLQPMVPKNRPNMIAWVAARNDAPTYGGVRVYRFPVDTTVFGPAQIEARIDQDPLISAQTTLWNQSGSRVIRGNLIVVPVGESLLYLQPVYLQSTASKFPEFQRIIVASATKVVWAPTLTQSLQLLLQVQGTPSPTPSPTPGPSPSGPAPSGPAPSGPAATPAPSGPAGIPSDVPGLIAYANQHFELAQQALRNGDFATYGREIALVQQALERLGQLVPPSAAP